MLFRRWSMMGPCICSLQTRTWTQRILRSNQWSFLHGSSTSKLLPSMCSLPGKKAKVDRSIADVPWSRKGWTINGSMKAFTLLGCKRHEPLREGTSQPIITSSVLALIFLQALFIMGVKFGSERESLLQVLTQGQNSTLTSSSAMWLWQILEGSLWSFLRTSSHLLLLRCTSHVAPIATPFNKLRRGGKKPVICSVNFRIVLTSYVWMPMRPLLMNVFRSRVVTRLRSRMIRVRFYWLNFWISKWLFHLLLPAVTRAKVRHGSIPMAQCTELTMLPFHASYGHGLLVLMFMQDFDHTRVHLDHLPVVLHLQGFQEGKAEEARILWDQDKLRDPWTCQQFQRSLATLPIPRWDVDADVHCQIWEEQFLQVSRQFFERSKTTKPVHSKRPKLSETTLNLISFKRQVLSLGSELNRSWIWRIQDASPGNWEGS